MAKKRTDLDHIDTMQILTEEIRPRAGSVQDTDWHEYTRPDGIVVRERVHKWKPGEAIIEKEILLQDSTATMTFKIEAKYDQ